MWNTDLVHPFNIISFSLSGTQIIQNFSNWRLICTSFPFRKWNYYFCAFSFNFQMQLIQLQAHQKSLLILLFKTKPFFTGSEVKPWTSDASISLKPNPGLPMFCLFLLMNKFLNSWTASKCWRFTDLMISWKCAGYFKKPEFKIIKLIRP